MKAKIKEHFQIAYKGNVEVFEKGAIAEGWPAKRAIAAGKAVPHTPRKKAPEAKVSAPPENKQET